MPEAAACRAGEHRSAPETTTGRAGRRVASRAGRSAISDQRSAIVVAIVAVAVAAVVVAVVVMILVVAVRVAVAVIVFAAIPARTRLPRLPGGDRLHVAAV